MMNMQKSEKTMAEMQIDLNMAYEGRITEAGSALQPLSGPGYDSSTELLLPPSLLGEEVQGCANALLESLKQPRTVRGSQ